MPVFVDNARIQWRGMLMSHLYADSLDELLRMVDRIGVARKWLQKPPKASWVHFDISEGKRRLAIVYGAIETDIFGPVDHCARQDWNAGRITQDELQQRLARVENSRKLRRLGKPLTAPPEAPGEPEQQELF
jgi:hypothetical protein